MIDQRLNFIEWMKAMGMLIIVYGHTNGHSIFNPTLPVNLKQIGVVFFIIATGYLLAKEHRSWPRVFYNRLFELFLFGILFTMALSAVNLYRIGDLNESNYLPFMLGLNVIFNSFPANPSLWYIGTYIHILIVWALVLRYIRVRLWMFFLLVPIEVAVRAFLVHYVGDFIAYQAFTNWISVLMLGMYLGQQCSGDLLDSSKISLIGYIAAIVAAGIAWLLFTQTLGVTASNPFGRLQWGNSTSVLIASASSVSLVYLTCGILFFQIFRRLRAGPIVKFLGRNSMLIFIIHMPMIWASVDWLYKLPGVNSSGYLRLIMNLLVFYVGCSVLSEMIHRLLKPIAIRNAVENKFFSIKARRTSSSK